MLPTYSTFSANLKRLPSYTSPEDLCPICQEPYYSSCAQHDCNSYLLLSHLPFPPPLVPPDIPTLLPCTHTLGSLCLQHWFDTGANTCPLCRQQLFAASSTTSSSRSSAAILAMNTRYAHRLEALRRMSLRELIKEDWRTLTVENGERLVRISTNPMVQSLSALMIRVAFRLSKVPDTELLRIWHSPHRTAVEGSTRYPCTTPSETSTEAFRGLISILASGADLSSSGKYPGGLELLFKPDMGIMYATICREIDARYKAEVAPQQLYDILSGSVQRAWETDTWREEWTGRGSFLDLLLRAWINYERRVTCLRRQMEEEIAQR